MAIRTGKRKPWAETNLFIQLDKEGITDRIYELS